MRRYDRRSAGGDDLAGWEADAEWALIQQRPIRARLLLYGLIATLAILLGWAWVAEIDEVARGSGRVIPSAQLQIVQSFDGGVVSEILVREGQIVEQGEVLVRIDPTRFLADLGETRASESALRARVARLEALLAGESFRVETGPSGVPSRILEEERRLFESSRDELQARVEIARRQLQQREQELAEARSRRTEAAEALRLVSRELQVTEPLVATGAVSEVEVLRLQREMSRARGDRDQASTQINRLLAAIGEYENRVREVELAAANQWRSELADVLGRLSEIEEGTAGLEDRVRLSEVRSPMRGVVQRLFVATRGGVVTPGREVAEIVPLDDQLLIEAQMSPRDIGFLRPGLAARVRFTAYDFALYGGLSATLEHISPDAILDEQGNPFFMVRVRTDETGFGEDSPIMTGMVAEVDIITGKRTVLQYLLKPVLRATEVAFTER